MLFRSNSLLAGLPASAIKPLQRIQNAAARLVFNLPKFSHVTPLFRDLNWLPVVACIRFKMMVLAYKAVDGTAPAYLQELLKPHTPARSLRSTTSAGRLVPPSLRASKGPSTKSQLFCFGTSVVERAPCRCQDCRVVRQLPQNTQNSPVQSSTRLCTATDRKSVV